MCGAFTRCLTKGTRQFGTWPRPGLCSTSRGVSIDPVVLRGRDQVRAWAEREGRRYGKGDTPAGNPKKLIDAGDKVLAFIRTSGRGKASGVEVEAYVWNVWTFRDGKPVEWTYFGEDRAAALEAVGLSE